MQRPKGPPPTDEQILAYRNVPIDLAARYMGTGATALRYGLQQGRVPFGWASRGEQTWYYNVSAEALVRYKLGEVPTYGLQKLLEIAADEIMLILETKLQAAKKSLDVA